MKWNLVRLADVRSRPWRNGGGTTRELLAMPGPDDWRLRISVAEVENDGPFSAFAGVKRWFAVLHGAGVVLKVGDREHRVTRDDPPLAFDGGAAVDCHLIAGATQDLNLMVRGRVAAMHRVTQVRQEHCDARVIVAVYANAPTSITVDDEPLVIDEGMLAWRAVDHGARVRVESRDALWMEIEP
ncbi:HutD family protein [Caenimonas koreensis]|uniref:HutD/Ves family protein n=1 Tax=Caenimonas koreensis TaxID=367474 RepID=UPI003784BFD7